MKDTTAIAFALAISSALPAFAGVMPEEMEAETPFYWEVEADAEQAPELIILEQEPKATEAVTTPQERLLEGYPIASSPKSETTNTITPSAETVDVQISVAAPGVDLVGADSLDEVGTETAPFKHVPFGADGVIRGVQDNPTAQILRRGDSEAQPAAGYAHPDEIRRVNAFDDYRPAIQGVGERLTATEEVHGIVAGGDFITSDENWATRRGESLKETLQAWSDFADYQLVWEAPYDFKLSASATIEGSFLDAVSKTMAAFEHSTPPIKGAVFPENKVLIISTSNEFSGW